MDCTQASRKSQELLARITKTTTIIDERNKALEKDLAALVEAGYDTDNLQAHIDEYVAYIEQEEAEIAEALTALDADIETAIGNVGQ